jgi:hypothetical protein
VWGTQQSERVGRRVRGPVFGGTGPRMMRCMDCLLFENLDAGR